MSEVKLTVSEKFTPEDAESIRSRLGCHLPVGTTQRIHRASFDPPSLIQLLGAVEAWQILEIPALAFVTWFSITIAKKAGEATWDRFSDQKNNKDIEPLVAVVTTLVEATPRGDGEVHIGIGLNIPDNFYGTVIWTDSCDPIQVARNLSVLVVNAKKIARTAQAEIEHGNKPVGSFVIELENDGSMTIRWTDHADFKIRKTSIR